MRYIVGFNESKNYGELYRFESDITLQFRQNPDECKKNVFYERYVGRLFNILKQGIPLVYNDLIYSLKTGEKKKFSKYLKEYDYKYSLCCTRNKNLNFASNIRIVLDGQKISDNYIIKPVSYSALISIDRSREEKRKSSIYNRKEYEERIFSNKPGYINHKCIKEIQIDNSLKPMEDEIVKSNIYNIKIKFIDLESEMDSTRTFSTGERKPFMDSKPKWGG